MKKGLARKLRKAGPASFSDCSLTVCSSGDSLKYRQTAMINALPKQTIATLIASSIPAQYH